MRVLPRLRKPRWRIKRVISLLCLGLFAYLFLFKFGGLLQTLAENSGSLIPESWLLSAADPTAEKYQAIDPGSLLGKDTLRLTFNLHGTCLLGGDGSAIIFDQPPGGGWHFVSLLSYSQNCLDAVQTADIPLVDFPGLDPTQPVGLFHTRFWNTKGFNIEILSAQLINTKGDLASPVLSPLPTATSSSDLSTPVVSSDSANPVPIVSQPAGISSTPNSQTSHSPTTNLHWDIKSVSSMKETKDKICSPDSQDFINKWLDKAKELGVNYVAIETPYDNPACGDAYAYTAQWVAAARLRGLKIWHRHMPLAFEGIYNTAKTKSDFLASITDYIKKHPDLFKPGDIFTPIPEPQNGGISGVTYCVQGVCQFSGAADFNQWLRSAIDEANSAFASVGLGGQIKIGYFGFDGFVAWGDNNPDWQGILENATVQKMGNITIDHYPETVGETMAQGLDALQAKYPNVPIVIGEWGTVTGGDTVTQVLNSMGAAQRTGVIGFNYWHLGMGGNESLINDDFSVKPDFLTVQSVFNQM